MLLCFCKLHFTPTSAAALPPSVRNSEWKQSAQLRALICNTIQAFPAKCTSLRLHNTSLSAAVSKPQVGFWSGLLSVYSLGPVWGMRGRHQTMKSEGLLHMFHLQPLKSQSQCHVDAVRLGSLHFPLSPRSWPQRQTSALLSSGSLIPWIHSPRWIFSSRGWIYESVWVHVQVLGSNQISQLQRVITKCRRSWLVWHSSG